MSSDFRGFVYALEPLLRQRQWRVDAAQARLGRLQREIDAVVHALEALVEAQRVAGQEATRAFANAGDSRGYARRLQWLVQLRDRRAALGHELVALQDKRRALREECLGEQRTLDAVVAHRDHAVQDHLRAQAARSATEADRDWLVRIAVRTSPTGGPLA